MIYYCCALYSEAKPIIEYYGLKRLDVKGRYQFFTVPDNTGAEVHAPVAVLVVCGTGRDNANAAVTMLCTIFPPSEKDIFVNYGICGSFSPRGEEIALGELYMAYGIKEEKGNTIYTDSDLLRPCGFKTAELRTFGRPVTSVSEFGELRADENAVLLADMEGYGAVFGASLFFQCHRIFVFKAVSDIIGTTALPENRCSIEKIIGESYKKVIEYAELALASAEEYAEKYSPPEFTEEETDAYNEFSERLCLSASMKEQLLCILRRRKLQGLSVCTVMQDFNLGEDRVCRNKGKILFECFKKYEVDHA
jgi:hypothetical protein